METFNVQIGALNKFGYNVVKIIDPIDHSVDYYISDSFTPVDAISSTTRTFKHVIKGRNITEFLNQRMTQLHNNTSQMEEGIICSGINDLPSILIEYSSHFLWIMYRSGYR